MNKGFFAAETTTPNPFSGFNPWGKGFTPPARTSAKTNLRANSPPESRSSSFSFFNWWSQENQPKPQPTYRQQQRRIVLGTTASILLGVAVATVCILIGSALLLAITLAIKLAILCIAAVLLMRLYRASEFSSTSTTHRTVTTRTFVTPTQGLQTREVVPQLLTDTNGTEPHADAEFNGHHRVDPPSHSTLFPS